MNTANFSTHLKSIYQFVKIPVWCIFITILIRTFYKPILDYFPLKPEYYDLVKTDIDIILMLIILIATIRLFLKTITFVTHRLEHYAKENNKKILLLLIPLLRNSTQIISFLLLLYLFMPYFNFPENYETSLSKFISIITIVTLAIIVIKSIAEYENIILDYYNKNINRDLRARQIYTQTHILRQVIIIVVVVLALASIFMVFENLRQIGVSLLASAGLISAIVGLAAQKSLANVIACLQLAFTRIIRIGDDVIIESETGKVEEITLTYIVLKLGDLRRMIIPINYLNEKPFQNLSRNSSQLVGPILLYVDYNFPVEIARKEFKKIVEASPHWDKEIAALYVSDSTHQAMELKLVVSAENAPKLWELRCEVREKMLNYITKNFSTLLPKLRTENPKAHEF